MWRQVITSIALTIILWSSATTTLAASAQPLDDLQRFPVGLDARHPDTRQDHRNPDLQTLLMSQRNQSNS